MHPLGGRKVSINTSRPTVIRATVWIFGANPDGRSVRPVCDDQGHGGHPDYDPKNQEIKAKAIRDQKFAEVSELLTGIEYWQFRYRWWLGRKYNYIREEVAFYFGYTWNVLRPMAAEIGRRMVEAGTFLTPEDTYFLVTDELDQAIAARKSGKALPELGRLASERRELREARKRSTGYGS